jgi:NTP pyrophosphatase (non-canonical NTP hydrolase)
MDGQLSFRSYQEEANRTDRAPGNDSKAMMVPLLGLAGEVGSLLAEYKKWLREGDRYKPFTDQVSEEIGDILWYLANIASKEGLDLQEIAEENLAKVVDRYLPHTSHVTPLFRRGEDRYDNGFPEGERLPLEVRVQFSEVIVDGAPKTELIYGGQRFGDRLTDNAHTSDGYRFHDVFHWTLAIVLGWSPIVRHLLRVKRRSVPRIDEVEDGGRAAVVEEAIAALVFAHAKDHSFFEGATSVDYELLRAVKLVTSPFEVRDRTFRDWEEAILKAYAIWRPMAQNNGGVFIGEAHRRSVEYGPPSSIPLPVEPARGDGS